MALLNEINVKGVPHPIVTDDGYYQEMTVGDAEQLVATTFTEDDAPYNFRTAGGAIDIGDRKQVEGIVGGTVAWNQLIYGNFSAANQWTALNGDITVTDNVLTNTMTATVTSSYNFKIQQSLFNYMNTNDKIFMAGTVSPSITGGLQIALTNATSANNPYYGTTIPANTWKRENIIFKVNEGAHHFAQVYLNTDYANWQVGDSYKVKDFIAINLTRLFGSTIADYIYSLETATAGAGCAFITKMFPKLNYAFDAGSLQSVQAASHDTVGFNAWDEQWELGYYNVTTGEPAISSQNLRSKNFIPVIPNTSYYAKTPTGYIAICEYDADKNFIKCTQGIANSGITTTADTHFIRFYCTSAYGTTYNNDICINLSWDGERDGEYEEYVKHVYELDPDLELRGVPKLSAGNDLYYDGDVYEPDGTVTRKYGIVDLGTLNWAKISTQGDHWRFYVTYDYAKAVDVSYIGNLLCPKYQATTAQSSYGGVQGVAVQPNNTHTVLMIVDETYSDAADFKTAMSGVYLVYELAEPTEETADSYNGTQIVDDFGTEEFVDAGVAAETPTRDVAIPVGHNSLYQPNLRAKLEMVPEAPEDEGYYVVYHHDGINEYVPLIIPQELPELPSEDGTYTLKCAVTSGSATLSFESEV